MYERECRDITVARAASALDLLACERCGQVTACTLHHRIKRSHLPRARLWLPSNCVMLCGHGTAGCHGWVEHNPNAAEAEGFHVRPWNTPSDVPVQLWYTDSPVCLDNHGGFDPCCEVDNG